MDANFNYAKYLTKMESDLSDYIISEMFPPNSEQRKDSEIYKYRGLMLLSIDPRIKRFEKTFLVRIGTLEAEFSLITGEKIHGGLGSVEDKLVFRWMNQGDNAEVLQMLYRKLMQQAEQEAEIRPFDLDGSDDDDY